MAKSKKRGGKKAHGKRVKSRNEKVKGKQNSIVKRFQEQLDAGVAAELEKQAEAKKVELDGTEERTMDSTMSAPPIK